MREYNINTDIMVLKGYINWYNSNPDVTREELYKNYYDYNYEYFMEKGSLDKYLTRG